jgi:mannose-6-phosphate isomerase-like protein (cupin superfamily)
MRTIVLSASAILLATAASAQPAPDALDLSAAEIQAMVKLAVNNPMKSIDAGKHTVFYVMEARKATREQGNGITHDDITEIYLIVEGSGTLRTGGALANANRLYDGGRGGALHAGTLPGTADVPRFPSPSFTGTAQGGRSRKVNVGDMIVIPPKTVHAWDSVDSPTLAYLTIRIDPEHKLHPGYTHPALKK